MKKICLFSDGSCLNNPGAGGWAYILEYEGYKKSSSGGATYTTNNKMEIQAVIEGLKALKEPCEVSLYTDSSYVANAINIWLDGWIKKKFKNVKNVELWQELLELLSIHKVSANWVKAHNGHPQNEECDKLARDQAIKAQNG
ncbi:ribonuclease HI [Campylobacter fetus]|uniref:Ribonuclease H n=1 Tax=Campylobacter fetus subsp. testudinum TaxID=1507806 RepID=A0AAX0HAM4_CAMFE|nr:ribonuclease HI [Campylobacter fetus]AGZ82522.1 ribonuclease HI [Campylobacter fetus subsp. testudinum 03-427]AJB46238.1 ribonuclease H [Campylobacter fetus subsp. testudinum]ALV65690.1 ribonuclease HI [Campylobacter fetus subsp. testudinum Sp3]AVK81926.1 ribonuclease HI [Campylobacter fetus subsp. testudinum]EAI4322452.1 ribonuclease HI [Campylobacter fetus]